MLRLLSKLNYLSTFSSDAIKEFKEQGESWVSHRVHRLPPS